MKVFLLIFSFFLITNPATYSQPIATGCKDSSFRLRYTSVPDSLQVVNFKQGSNGTFLFCGHLVHTLQSNQLSSMVFGKISEAGKVIWAKYANSTSFPVNCIVQDFEETTNVIYWAGTFSGVGNKPFIIKTDISGSVIESFYFTINYGTGTPHTEIKRIKYISDDEIYFTISAAASGTFPPYSIVTRIRNDGTVLWSKAFRTGDGFSTYFGKCTDIYKQGNELVVLGDYSIGNFIDNPNNKAGFFKMKLNSSDGSLVQMESSYIPLFREFDFTSYVSADFKLTSLSNGFAFSGFINGSPIAPGSTYRNKAIKINLDNNFNIIKITEATAQTLDLKDRIIDFDINYNNESCIVINNDENYYFAILNSTDSLVSSRKLKYAFKKPQGKPFKGLILDNNSTITHFAQYDLPPSDKYELLKLKKSWPNSSLECMGIDTFYFKVKTINHSISDFAWQSSATTNMQKQSFNISDADFTFQDELICKEFVHCDSIKLSIPDTVCNISEPVTMTAHRNPSCIREVTFTFDTTAVTFFSQPNDTTLILSFNKDWSGKIYASPASCPSLTDSAQLIVIAPVAPVNLGRDTIFCPGHTYILKAPAGYKQYQWQNGSSDSSFIASQPGKYFVTVTDYCGRISSDTIQIKETNINLSAGKDTSICQSEKIQLQATQGFSNYIWSPSYKVSSTSGSTVTVFPDTTTNYSVSAEKFPGCVLKDSVVVSIKDCPQRFFVPSAFSPNHDGKNDIFKPIITGTVSNYEFSIYNRWGQVVFRSTNKDLGWDGTVKKLNQDNNVFVWVCKFQFTTGAPQTKNGTVLLLK